MMKFFNLFYKVCNYLKTLLLISLVTFLLTSFIVAYHFNLFTPISVISNIIAVPLFSFIIMPLALIVLITIPFNLHYFFLDILNPVYFYLKNLARFFTDLNFTIHTISVPDFALFLFLFAFFFYISLNNKMIKRILIIIMLAAVGVSFASPKPEMLIAKGGEILAVKQNNGRLIFFGNVSLNKNIAHELIKNNGQDEIKDDEKNFCKHKKICVYKTENNNIYYLNRFKNIYENLKVACLDEKGIIVTPWEINVRKCNAKIYDKKSFNNDGSLIIN